MFGVDPSLNYATALLQLMFELTLDSCNLSIDIANGGGGGNGGNVPIKVLVVDLHNIHIA